MHQIISMEVSYGAAKAIKELTNEQYKELRQRFGEEGLPLDQSEVRDWADFKWVGTIEDVQWLTDLDIKVSIARVRGMYADRLPELGVPQMPGTQIVNVVIPNAALFAVRQLKVIEDDCTNTIQTWLNNGWRIVAVCPPNDTRRPTFILGHCEVDA